VEILPFIITMTPKEKKFKEVMKKMKDAGVNLSEGAIEDIWFEINEAGEFNY
jgi:hypothetical protein